jgi:hypothetical protein
VVLLVLKALRILVLEAWWCSLSWRLGLAFFAVFSAHRALLPSDFVFAHGAASGMVLPARLIVVRAVLRDAVGQYLPCVIWTCRLRTGW